MLNRRVRKITGALAVALTGTAITLAGTAITAPQASAAATGCVAQTFGYDPYTYQQCVLDMQVLLNDLWYDHQVGPDQALVTDGYYGPHTSNDVTSFNTWWNNGTAELGEMSPLSWDVLCGLDLHAGFHGAYWQNAGCATAQL
jgi:hypothetical protein